MASPGAPLPEVEGSGILFLDGLVRRRFIGRRVTLLRRDEGHLFGYFLFIFSVYYYVRCARMCIACMRRLYGKSNRKFFKCVYGEVKGRENVVRCNKAWKWLVHVLWKKVGYICPGNIIYDILLFRIFHIKYNTLIFRLLNYFAFWMWLFELQIIVNTSNTTSSSNH